MLILINQYAEPVGLDAGMQIGIVVAIPLLYYFAGSSLPQYLLFFPA